MNKKTKGIVAGAAGAAILLGTAGTFALWSTSDTVGGGVVTGGTFSLTADDIAWTWTDISPGGTASGAVTDGEITLVPGVQLTGTAAVSADLEGDHLFAELRGDQGTEPLPDWLSVTWEMADGAVQGQSAVLTPGDGDRTIKVNIVLASQTALPQDAVENWSGDVWTSGDFTVTLQQLSPSTPVS